jgi:hypothetical protein
MLSEFSRLLLENSNMLTSILRQSHWGTYSRLSSSGMSYSYEACSGCLLDSSKRYSPHLSVPFVAVTWNIVDPTPVPYLPHCCPLTRGRHSLRVCRIKPLLAHLHRLLSLRQSFFQSPCRSRLRSRYYFRDVHLNPQCYPLHPQATPQCL